MPRKSKYTLKDNQGENYPDPERHPTGMIPSNCRPMISLPLMNEIPTDKRGNLLLASMPQTVFRRTKKIPQGTRETGDLLYLDQHILEETKARRKNVAMAWIDNKMANGMDPKSWIVDCRKIYKIADINFIMKAMKN